MERKRDITVKTDTILENQYYINDIRKAVHNEEKKYHIITYGCQMNEHDSEKLAGMLAMMGYQETQEETEADFIIFNTCSVRENAEFKVYGNLGRMKHLKADKPDMILGVCGCMMQQPHVVKAIKEKYPFVNLVFGTHNLHNFPMYFHEAFFKTNRVIEVWEDSSLIVENLPTERKMGVKAFVNIMYGCNNFCTYCIVPYTRGREKSRNPEDIIKEIKELANEGIKEVTLLGQNVNSYGKTFASPYGLHDLLREINEIPGITRIRFMTSHPKDLSDEVIEAMAELPKVCEHLHLPVQSGSNRILQRMNRHYRREDYLSIINKLRSKMPNISFSTDIIIGFPGETLEDVEDTIKLIQEVEYDSAFTFIYSPRVGTPAADLEDNVTKEEKHERFDKMLAALNEIVIEKNARMAGKTLEVLVEGPSKSNPDMLMGRTRQFQTVNFKGDSSLVGQEVKVKITSPRKFSLNGELVKE